MERAERSGGLHKRSAEAWGNPLRARGAELPLAAFAVALAFQKIRAGVAGMNRPVEVGAEDAEQPQTGGDFLPIRASICYDIRRRYSEDKCVGGTMIHAVVAESAGVTLGDLDSLLTGRVYASIADKLGIPMGYIESYIGSGSAAAVLAERLGVNMLAAEDLGARLGREGRIGLIFGLLLAD